ncbi:PAS domain S-box-containing protein [Rhodovulum steppense]|uniref:histidine kinase n=2 Tax=Paracoccaceae TaxID=31989 RepID=A0A4R1YWV6_9RHOB|nr:PAS domain S-box-containing protein [Rhodovulum steppense]
MMEAVRVTPPDGADGESEPDLETLVSAAMLGLDSDVALAVQALDGTRDGVRVRCSTAPGLVDRIIALPEALAGHPVVLDLSAEGIEARLPPEFAEYQSLVAAPLTGSSGMPGALVGLSRQAGAFSLGQQAFLGMLGRIATNGARCKTLTPADHFASPGGPLFFETDKYARLTGAQHKVSDALQDLLRSGVDEVDTAIDRALAAVGWQCTADRVYVFLTRDDHYVDNTHEWCADGVAPMIAELQGISIDEIAPHWIEAFGRNEAIHIPDVPGMPDYSPEKSILMMQEIKSLLAMPIIQGGILAGFIGIDVVHAHHEFLPGEISLLSMIANGVGCMLRTSAAADQMRQAQRRLQDERNRLRATLDAVPDIVVEFDSAGRFTGVHGSDPDFLCCPAETLIGLTSEEALPEATATLIRRVLTEAARSGRANEPEARIVTPQGAVFRSIAVRRRAPEADTAGPPFVLVARDVTEQVRNKAQLKRLSRIAETMTNLVILKDSAGRITWVNPAFQKRSGYTLVEVQGRIPATFLHGPETDPLVVERLAQAAARRERVSMELINYARNGERYWVETNEQPLFDGTGRHEGFLVVQTDITERKLFEDMLAEQALQALNSRQRIYAAVEALPDAFVFYDPDDRLVLCNERYRQYYPKTVPAILPGASFEEILRYGLEHGEYAEAVGQEQDWLAERLRRHRLDENDSEQLTSDGRWLRVVERRLPDGSSVGLRVDVTEFKRLAEEADAERLAALEASQDGISITSEDGRFLYMNKAFRDMFGIGSGLNIRDVFWWDLVAKAVPPADTFALQKKLSQDGNWLGELLLRRMGGTEFWAYLSVSGRGDGRALAIVRDVTSMKQAITEQARLREELQLAQRREVIGQLASGIAHDFNNILAAISGTISLLSSKHEDCGNVERLQAAVQEATSLIGRLSDLGRRKNSVQTFDMREQVWSSIDLMRADRLQDTELKLTLPPDPFEIEGDPTDVTQVALNLVLNASDAIRDKPDRNAHDFIEVTLTRADRSDLDRPTTIGTLEPERDYFRLAVADTGPGMNAEISARIFRENFTTKGEKGTGLGLPIVARVVTQNGGAIRMDTVPGSGSRFDVFWPVMRVPLAEVGPLNSLGDPTGRLDGATILVIDDNDLILRVLASFLEEAGAEVAASTDPADLLAAVRGDPGAWDLLVTDFNMPTMNGAELARQVHALDPGLPALLLTAIPDWRVRCGWRGPREFAAALKKPVSRNELVHAAEAAIAQRLKKEEKNETAHRRRP